MAVEAACPRADARSTTLRAWRELISSVSALSAW